MRTVARRQVAGYVIGVLLWILAGAGVAHAHGGMAGPDELGPPVGISVAIGLVCYYLITLWPARSDEDGPGSPSRTARHRGNGK